MPKIILLTGKKSTGKNTVANIISELCPRLSVTHMSFADPLKKIAMECFGLTWQQCYGESGERETGSPVSWREIDYNYVPKGKKLDSKMTARDVLQTVGTDIMRSFYPNIWANAAKIAAMNSKSDVVVFTDARFFNEIRIFGNDATTVRIMRKTGHTDMHSSEIALDDFDLPRERLRHIEGGLYRGNEVNWEFKGYDFVLYNDEGMEDLKHSVAHLVGEMDLYAK